MSEFGDIVRRRRRQLKLNMEELAQKTKVHRSYISIMECGKCAPSPSITLRIAEALGLNPNAMVAIGYWGKRPLFMESWTAEEFSEWVCNARKD